MPEQVKGSEQGLHHFQPTSWYSQKLRSNRGMHCWPDVRSESFVGSFVFEPLLSDRAILHESFVCWVDTCAVRPEVTEYRRLKAH